MGSPVLLPEQGQGDVLALHCDVNEAEIRFGHLRGGYITPEEPPLEREIGGQEIGGQVLLSRRRSGVRSCFHARVLALPNLSGNLIDCKT